MNPRDDRGQTIVMVVLFMTVIIGVSAMALDVGSWYHAKREMQATADAAALAGAQDLPDSTSQARADAIAWAAKNGMTLSAGNVTFSSDVVSNDTINVHVSGPEPGFFSKIFGIKTVTVGASSAARSDNIYSAWGVAPIAVYYKHPMLQCAPLPCSDPTQINLANLKQVNGDQVAGAFTLLDVIYGDKSVGTSELASWITDGFNGYMALGNYYSRSGAAFNSSAVTSAMTAAIGQTLIFPIYQTVAGSGANALYQIIAFAGFYVTGFDATGSSGAVYGHFTRVITQGFQVSKGSGEPDYGVRSVQLVN